MTSGCPRTSFLGIPPELRVRIYSFLFAGNQSPCKTDREAAIKRNVRSPHNEQNHDHAVDYGNIHCCSIPDKAINTDEAPELPIICPCFGPLHPQLLSTNKLIYREASALFYRNLELRLRLPSTEDTEKRYVQIIFAELLKIIPTWSLSYITNILLAQPTSFIGHKITRNDHNFEQWDQFWSHLAILMPNIRHVRLHVDVNTEIDLESCGFGVDERLATLPKLKSVGLETWICRFGPYEKEDFTVADGRGFEGRLALTIERKAKSLGRRVKVVRSSADLSGKEGGREGS